MNTQSTSALSDICHINLARVTELRGAERQTELLLRELAAASLRQRLVVSHRGALAERLHDVPNLTIRAVRSRPAALWACRNSPFVHAHEPHAAQVAYAFCRHQKPYVITRHWHRPVGSSWYSQRMYASASAVVGVSNAVVRVVREQFPRLSVRHIPNAWMNGEPDQATVRRLQEKFSKKFLIGNIAIMEHRKGHDLLLQAARQVQRSHPHFQFILVGHGPLEQELKEQAQDLPNVTFAGWADNPLSYLAICDVFAFPSRHDALGSVLLDAMRMGVPIIASNVDGIPEVVTSECGILVPPEQPDTLAAALVRLSESPEERRRMARGAREKAAQFSPATMAAKYLSLYGALGLVPTDPASALPQTSQPDPLR